MRGSHIRGSLCVHSVPSQDFMIDILSIHAIIFVYIKNIEQQDNLGQSVYNTDTWMCSCVIVSGYMHTLSHHNTWRSTCLQHPWFDSLCFYCQLQKIYIKRKKERRLIIYIVLGILCLIKQLRDDRKWQKRKMGNDLHRRSSAGREPGNLRLMVHNLEGHWGTPFN